jgi:ribonuclease Z
LMKITFLGTAGSTPTKLRNLPALAIDYNGGTFLFDCGEGTQRQCMFYSVNISRIKAIFLSHIHGDHTIGVAGLLRTLSLNKRTEPLYIFIPKGYEDQLLELINFDRATMNYRIIISPIAKSGIIYKDGGFSISAFRLIHTNTTYGFSFNETDKTKFIKQKVRQLGIKGEMFRQLLKEGEIKIGKKIVKLEDITFKEPGRKIVYATDTRPSQATVRAAANADLLIHESTYAEKEKKLAKERFHSTAMEGATIAKKAGAKRLVFVHISARYKETEQLLKESRSIFKNTEIAKDGMIINL